MSWHNKTAESAFESLNTTSEGLLKEEASSRLAKYGANQLPELKTRNLLMRFFSQFNNVLIYVLLIASVITAVLGHWVDASVIFGVVLSMP